MNIFEIPQNALIVADRIFVALRKGGGISGRRPLYHAVTPYCRMALCSAEPWCAVGMGGAASLVRNLSGLREEIGGSGGELD